ncbi:RmlC-like cupin domain-containing protein [Xylariales sp. PMI_506]|nr:RmlC-like cupin domain-containing protein [Xylariales sp. PMI_506]
MDEQVALEGLATPDRQVIFVPARAGEVLQLGPATCRIMEDGSNTDNRIGSAEFIIPAGSQGPPAHWHEMHDETFLVTAGTIRFHGPGGQVVDAKAGDYAVVPTRAPHTFSNPDPEVEARFFNTFTPAYYINYFKLLAAATAPGSGQKLTKEAVMEAQMRFATMPAKEMQAGLE